MVETIISGPQVYTEDGVLQDAALIIRDGLIESIAPISKVKTTLEFPANYHLVPGFIDLHVHGANNQDVMDATQEALTILSQTLAAEGTTAFLATTMTAATHDIEKALIAVHDFMQNKHHEGAAILGVHLEGPFISPKKIGAQNAKYILAPESQRIAEWQKKSGNSIKLVTLAPELANSVELIRYLKKHNIMISMGHTDATFAETEIAIQEGCHYATHLFNAMRGIQQREPGVVTAALLSDEVTTELIVDGVHLHPAIVELILKIKGSDKIVLVTDSMRAKCLGEGTYDLGGQEVHVEKGTAKLADGTLAGSVLRMPEAIKNLLKFADSDLSTAIKMTSENPAKILGIFNNKGSIALGKDADLVVLDDQLNVVMTMVGGSIVYTSQDISETSKNTNGMF